MNDGIKHIGKATASIINLHNQRDQALEVWWSINQDMKPDIGAGYYYDWLTGKYATTPLAGNRELNFIENYDEIYSYISEARSKALGEEPNTGGAIDGSVDLHRSPFLYGPGDWEHSAQFRGLNNRRASYWEALLDKFDLQ